MKGRDILLEEKTEIFAGRRKFLPALFALVGAILFINILGEMTFDISALRFAADLNLAFPGFTRLEIPPIGQIVANTHILPVQISLSLQNIDLPVLRALLQQAEGEIGEQALLILQQQSRRIILLFVMRAILLAGIGGAMAAYVQGQRAIGKIMQSFLLGAVLIAILLGITYWSYDTQAFQSPEYRGIIEAAPWMIDLIQESLVRVEELEAQIEAVAASLYSAFQQIEELRPLGVLGADVVVLHISDIHNNPVAYDFVGQVAESFPVDFIVDTGDITDWGTPLETEMVRQIEEFDLPYLFVSGNHESPDVIDRLAQLDNVVLLENVGTVTVKGLRIAGIGDAGADSYSPATAPLEELLQKAELISNTYRNALPRPDLFAVHNHRIANAIEPGIFPVIVFGHSHTPTVEQRNGTVYINAGTTGAAGIRGLQVEPVVPFSLSLLYFGLDTQERGYRLIAIDGIRVQELGRSFSLERTFITSRIPEDNVEIPNNRIDDD